jgi:type IV pilus assembly protein PilQ
MSRLPLNYRSSTSEENRMLPARSPRAIRSWAAVAAAALATGAPFAAVTVSAVVARPAAARAETTPRRITTVDVDGAGDTTYVKIRGWKQPVFTAYRLDRPDRVMVDLRDGDISELAVKGAIAGKGPVLKVTPRHIADSHVTVARLTIDVKPGTTYEIRNEGDDLVIELRAGKSAGTFVQHTPVDESSIAPKAPVAAVAAPVAVSTAPAPTPAARADDKVVRVEVDRLPGDVKSGTRLTEARLVERHGRAVLSLRANGPVASYQIMELKEPGRLALDLDGFEHGVKPKATSAGLVSALRIARRDGAVRVVLETKGDHFPPFTIVRTSTGLDIEVGTAAPVAVASARTEPVEKPKATISAPVVVAEAPKPAAPVALQAKVEAPKVVLFTPAAPAPAAAPVVVAAAVKPAVSARPSQIASIDVSGSGRMSRVIIAMTQGAQFEERTLPDGSHLLVLKNARLPRELARKLDTSALEGPVSSLASVSQSSDGSVRLLAGLRGSEVEAVSQVTPLKVGDSFGIEWKFSGLAPRRLLASNVAMQASGPGVMRVRGPGGFMGEAPAYAHTAGPRAPEKEKKQYSDKRVDFTAKDLDITQFLQAIAEVGKVNIISGDDVVGKVTIRLRNVPWDEALAIVLKTKNLGQERLGDNIIRVAPLKVLADEKSAELALRSIVIDNTPLKVRLIPVNFAPAAELAKQVMDVLTPKRGSLTIDERTNVLIVKDIPDALVRAEQLVRTLDTQTPQVLIEARIVEASTSFSRSVGIQWGGNVTASPGTGNATGLVFPNLLSIAGAADDTAASTAGTSATPSFAVNMPTAVGAGAGGGLGFIFGSAGGAANLNLRLTAAELGGTIKTVSAPKAVTIDNNAATIGQGVSIPFSQTSAAGVTTSFVEARLALNVTPHVTADGSVLLMITVTNNQPNPGLTGANGQPSISKREATTRVLVKDGDTTVIGGIYTRRTALSDSEVPFLAKIPILGALFRHNAETDDRTEMLIFISPRIINRQQSAVASGEGGFQLPPTSTTTP